MPYDFLYNVTDGVATITFNRPGVLNALTFDIYAQFRDLMSALQYDDAVKVVLLTGEGKAFCSGGDVFEIIGELLKLDMKGHLEFTRMTGAVVQNMRLLEKPIIAALNGTTAGAGAVISLASDFRIMSEKARMHFLFTKVGLTGADMGAAYLLPRIVGSSRAMEILMFGDKIYPDHALNIGWPIGLFPHDELLSTAQKWAARLAAGPTLAYGMTKRMVNNEWNMDLVSAIEQEAQAQALLLMGEDHKIFFEAFRDKVETTVDWALRGVDTMSKQGQKSLAIFPILVIVGAGMAWAGSQGGATILGFPLYAGIVGLIFVIQWVAFVPAFRQQDETFFDLVGSITYISVTLLALLLNPLRDARSFLIAAMVIIWAVRLGSFLYRRIHKAGKDGRFDDLKPHFWRFLNVWTIQALWVIFTAAAALVVLTSANRQDLGVFAWIGLLVWGIGFGIEVVADLQKSRFRADPANMDRFIQSGLWSYSRHPNYLGEIILWLGVTIIALPVLQGWQWVALISPIFVILLLTRVSGVPMLERRADAKWGGQEDYEAYKLKTPVLLPRFR